MSGNDRESFACGPNRMTPAAKRYMRDMGIGGLAYTIAVIGSASLVNHFDLPLWIAIAAALAPIAAALLMLRAYLVFIDSVDELQRRIQNEAILVAAGVVGFGSFAYGFLEGAADFPSIPGAPIWVLPAMIIVWGLALPLVTRRYR